MQEPFKKSFTKKAAVNMLYKPQKAELLLRFREFCASLSPKDKVAIIHHTDADGICSAVITMKAIEKITGRKPVAVSPFEYGNRKQALEAAGLFKKKKANILVIVDIGLDGTHNSLLKKLRFEKCLVIDHHKMRQDLNSKKTVFLKAEFFTEKDSSSYVTSKFAFDLFNIVVDLKGLDWVACIGILGDMSFKQWRQFVEETIARRKIPLSMLYSALELIAAVEVVAKGKITELLWLFYNAKGLNDVLESKFKKYLAEFRQEKDLLVEGFDGKAESFPEIELFFYAIKARHGNIKSYVVNEISQMHPNETIILLQFAGAGKVRFSARRQDGKIKMNELLVEAVKGIPNASAGGHAPAAAGSVPKKYLGGFKENIVKILKKKQGE